MCGVSGIELLVIVVAAVIFLGPDRLPEVMRTLGKLMREVRKVTGEISNVRDEFTRSVRDEGRTIQESVERRTHAGKAGQDVEDIDAIRARKAAKEAEAAAVSAVAGAVAVGDLADPPAEALEPLTASEAAAVAAAQGFSTAGGSASEPRPSPDAPPAEPVNFRDVRRAQAAAAAAAAAAATTAPIEPDDVRRALASDESPTGTRLMPRIRQASGSVAAGVLDDAVSDSEQALENARELSRLRQEAAREQEILDELRFLSPQAQHIARSVAGLADDADAPDSPGPTTSTSRSNQEDGGEA